MSDAGLAEAVSRMRGHGVSESAIRVFSHAYAQLEDDATGLIPEDSIEPLADVTALGDLDIDDDGARAALARTVVIKLGGGLGTSMGVTGAKSALEVRDGLTFLDITVRQVLALRERYAVSLPLLVMDSFRTREDSARILAAYPDLAVDDLPVSFLQSAEPKLRVDDLTPVDHPADPDLEWCPPGHGDVYVSLESSGLLAALLERGIRYAFLSNGDNLGATCDPAIAAWMQRAGLPYVAEVCERTRNDRKGGHLATRRSDGRLVLRDSAMVVPGEEEHFQGTGRHRYFHANNLWVDLEVLAATLRERDGVLGLPVIVNRKTVDPTDASSTPVIQVESAMGAAVEIFDGSQALLVPRERFRPVKTTNELLLLRSDLYELDEMTRVRAVGEGPEPFVDLARRWYAFVADFERRFPQGVPSIRAARSLVVAGDVTFGAGVVCRGDVRLEPAEPTTLADGTVLDGTVLDGTVLDGPSSGSDA